MTKLFCKKNQLYSVDWFRRKSFITDVSQDPKYPSALTLMLMSLVFILGEQDFLRPVSYADKSRSSKFDLKKPVISCNF